VAATESSNLGEGLHRTTLAKQVSARLVEEITLLGLQPGDKIQSEAELARRFGVNRLVVREAIRELTAREILTSSQGRPTQVRRPSYYVFGQTLDFLVRQGALSFADVLDARRALESDVARRAATHVGAGNASTLAAAAILHQLEAQLDSRDVFIDLDVRFHAELARMAKAPALQLILNSMELVLTTARQASYEGRARRGKGQAPTVEAHRRILEAVCAGLAEQAAERMLQHLDETSQDLEASDLPTGANSSAELPGAGAETCAGETEPGTTVGRFSAGASRKPSSTGPRGLFKSPLPGPETGLDQPECLSS